jgi:hypothetical protein
MNPATKDAWKAAGWTALWTFIALFLTSALGWLQDVYEWSSTSGAEPLPGISTLGHAAVTAGVSAISGFIAFAVRWAQSRNVLPGSPPVYPPSDLPTAPPGE